MNIVYWQIEFGVWHLLYPPYVPDPEFDLPIDNIQ